MSGVVAPEKPPHLPGNPFAGDEPDADGRFAGNPFRAPPTGLKLPTTLRPIPRAAAVSTATGPGALTTSAELSAMTRAEGPTKTFLGSMAQAPIEMAMHPIRTAAAPLESGATLVGHGVGDVMGPGEYAYRVGRIGETDVPRPGEVIPGGVTGRERAMAALQVGTTLAAGPVAGKVGGLVAGALEPYAETAAAQYVLPKIATAIGRGTVGAAVGATYSPENPFVGATIGAVAGGVHGYLRPGEIPGPKEPWQGAPTDIPYERPPMSDAQVIPESPLAPVPNRLRLTAGGDRGGVTMQPAPMDRTPPTAPTPVTAAPAAPTATSQQFAKLFLDSEGWSPSSGKRTATLNRLADMAREMQARGESPAEAVRQYALDQGYSPALASQVIPAKLATLNAHMEARPSARTIEPTAPTGGAAVTAAAPPPAAPPAIPPRPAIAGALGQPTHVLLSDGQALPAQYKIVSRDDLQPSHNAVTFQPNPDAAPGAQGRDLARNTAAQTTMQLSAMKYDSRVALNPSETAAEGVPTVLPDGRVIAGHGRVMMNHLAQLHAPDRYDAYGAALRDKAASVGVDPTAFAGIKRPMLVRVLTDPKDVTDPTRWTEINRLSDEPTTKAKSGAEDAEARAQRLTAAPQVLAHFGATIQPDETISSYLEGANGKAFTRQLVQHGVITPEEFGKLSTPGGGLTEDGKTAVRRMLLSAAVSDRAALSEAPASVVQRIEHAVPAIVSTRGTTFDVSQPLAGALKMLGEAKAKGMPLADLQGQGQMFETAARDPEVVTLARFLDSHGKAQVAAAFRRYGQLAREATGAAQSVDMFGGTGYDRQSAFAEAFGRAGEPMGVRETPGAFGGGPNLTPVEADAMREAKARELRAQWFKDWPGVPRPSLEALSAWLTDDSAQIALHYLQASKENVAKARRALEKDYERLAGRVVPFDRTRLGQETAGRLSEFAGEESGRPIPWNPYYGRVSSDPGHVRAGAAEYAAAGFRAQREELRGDGPMGVSARRVRIDPKQIDLFNSGQMSKSDVDITYGSAANRQALIDRVRAMAGPMRADRTLPTSAIRLRAINKPKADYVSLVGQKLPTNPDGSLDLVQFHRLMLPFRDPNAEYMSTLLLDADHRVLDHTLETSGALGYVRLDRDWLTLAQMRARAVGATHMAQMHNHPSGNYVPSDGDRGYTWQLERGLKTIGLTLEGHYVIDHEHGTWIAGKTGKETPVHAPAGAAAPIDWTELQSAPLTTPEQLHVLAREADPLKALGVAYVSANSNIVALEPHPIARLMTLEQWLPDRIKLHSAESAVLVLPGRAGASPASPDVLRWVNNLMLGPLGAHIADIGLVVQHEGAPPTIHSLALHGQYARRLPTDANVTATRVMEPAAAAPGAGGGGAVGGGPPAGPAAPAPGQHPLVPAPRGVVQAGKTFLANAADFFATASHDPIAAARRVDPDYAELGDKALAAKPFADHFARTTATWTDEGLTPAESITLSRVQIVNRLKEINGREDMGQMDLIPEDAGERGQREATIRRYSAMIPPRFLADPKIQEALRRRRQIYRDVMEPAAIAGNVDPASFSRAPTGHIKLVPVRPEGALAQAMSGTTGGATTTAQAAKTAKGTAVDYETDWRTVLASDARDKFHAAATNLFYRGTAARGRVPAKGELPNPREIRVSFPDPANVVPGFGPKVTVAMPNALGQAFNHIDPYLGRQGAPSSSVMAFLRVLDQAAGQAMFSMNVAALTSHSKNMANAEASIPEAGPMGWLHAAAKMVPGVKLGYGFADIANLDMRTPAARAMKMRLASVGALRPVELSHAVLDQRFQTAKANLLKRMGQQLNPDVRRQIEKLSVFGENGIDERARVAMGLKYLRQNAAATDAEVGRYVNRLAANYTRGLGGIVVNALQHFRFAMFARIETAKLGLGARTAIGRSLLPTHSPQQAAELWIKQLMQGPIGSRVGLAAAIAAASILLGRKLVQAPGKENDIPTGQKDAQGRDVYINGRMLSPSDAILTDLGVDALARGDTRGAIQAATNTVLRVGVSHPLAKLGAATLGVEPNVGRDLKPRALGPRTISGLPRLKNVVKAVTGVTSISPFVREPAPNAGMPGGRALAYLGLNITSTAGQPEDVKLSRARQDASDWLDDMKKAIGQAPDGQAAGQVVKDAIAEGTKAGKGNPYIAAALNRAHWIYELQHTLGRSAARRTAP